MTKEEAKTEYFKLAEESADIIAENLAEGITDTNCKAQVRGVVELHRVIQKMEKLKLIFEV